jgi:hypothetical protein
VVLTEVLPCEMTDLRAPPYGVHASRGGANMLALLLGLGGQRAGAQEQERCDRGQVNVGERIKMSTRGG